MSDNRLVKAVGDRGVGWLAALVFLATFALFSPAIGYDFVALDDGPYVAENPTVREGISAASLQWAMTANVLGFWGPATWLSYMIDAEVHGPGPGGFHATNVLLHALNAALVFGLLRRWTGRTGASCAGALLWAWHPLRVESVAWIAERKDVLSGFFFLLALTAYTGRAGWHGWRRWMATGCVLMGLMAKAMLVTAPVVLLLLDAWPLGRIAAGKNGTAWTWVMRTGEKWVLWLACAAVAAGIWAGHAATGTLGGGALPARLARAPMHAFQYLWATLWPADLAALYPDLDISGGRWVWALTGLSALLAWGWVFRHRRPAVVVGLAWYAVMLLPVSGIISFGSQSHADRFTYLPAIGLSLAIVALAPRGRGWAVAAGVVSAALAGLTLLQLPYWRDTGALYARVRAVAPGHFQAGLNLGVWHLEQGRAEDARPLLAEAWARSAQHRREILGNAAREWVCAGRAREAQVLLAAAVADPRAPGWIHGIYGMACLHEGQAAEAVRHLERAIATDPSDTGFQMELARALFAAGEPEKGRAQAARVPNWPGAEIRTAGDLFPFYVQRWRDGAMAYAWRYFEEQAAERPDDVPLLNNVAWLAATDRRTPARLRAAALEWARRAVRLTAGDNAAALDTLAAALAATGDFAAAAGEAEKARAAALRAGDADLAAGIARRATAYRGGRAWRE